jgi:VIT1/CCC1 family predicted Fe2+/Mn2+ transporter
MSTVRRCVPAVPVARVLVRVVVGGLLAMGLTYGVGALFGASG